MFTTIRRYEGVTNPSEAANRVRDGFVPIISAMPGFIAYYWIEVGNKTMVSISIFNSLAQAIESNGKASAWANANLKGVLPRNPVVESGPLVVSKH